MHAKLHYLLALCGGLFMALSFPSWSYFPLAWVGVVLLWLPAFSLCPGQAALHFFASGLLFHLLVLQWLTANVFWAGGYALLGYVLLCAYLAGYWAALGALWAWTRKGLSSGWAAPLAGLLWVAMEFAQATLFTGFGWTALGYAQAANPSLAQWAALGGVGLVGFWVVVPGVLAAQALAQAEIRWKSTAAALALLLLTHLAGWTMLAKPTYASPSYRVGLYQSDNARKMQLDPAYTASILETAAVYTRGLAWREPLDLVVWPEGLVLDPVDAPTAWPYLEALAADTSVPLFTGTVRFHREAKAWSNSSALITPDGEIAGHYDKMRLAPFGEYLPLRQTLSFVGDWVPIIGDMQPGEQPAVFEAGERRFLPLICFEILFADMSRPARGLGADSIVVITDLNWFGQTNVLAQERAITQIRAIENRLPIVHAANTGYSGIADPWGRFTAIGPPHERLTGAADLPQPARHPLPWGPRWFSPMALLGLAILHLLSKSINSIYPVLRN